MLDSYDMPMLDYPSDLDIQMHPSTSDQWLQDEAEMEEDGSYLPSKNDFEVDMEPSADDQNVEYDMLDDDEIRESGAEVLDVEVYDVSLAQSPAMVNLDIPYEQPPSGLTSFQRIYSSSGLHEDSPLVSSNFLLEQSSEIQVLEPSAEDTVFREDRETTTYEASSEVIKEPVQPPAQPEVTLPDQHESHGSRDSNEVLLDDHDQGPPQHFPASDEVILPTDEQELQQAEYYVPRDNSMSHSDDQVGVQSQDVPSEIVVVAPSNSQTIEAIQGLHAVEDEGSHLASGPENDTNPEAEQSLEQQEQGLAEQDHSGELRVEVEPASAHASGDPHEISEGVYIDPPPPVLLTLASEDQSHFCLFNQAQDREADSENASDHQVLLHQLPTLYYEPLSTVFDALRQESSVQAVFHLADSELVLEAIDLQLIISEDNVYAVDVSLHDLNVLHDGSGIGGLLRMRLSAVTPRFITRYQYLQEQVTRLHLEQPFGEALTEPTTVVETSQEVSEETDRLSEPEANVKGDQSQSTKAAESGVPDGDNVNNTDPSQGLSEVPVPESSEGPLPLSTSALEDSEENDEHGLHGDVESVQPIPQNETQDEDTNSSSSDFTVADHSSNAEGERQIVDDYPGHHAEDDTVPLEILEASHENGDTYAETDHTGPSRDSPPEDILSPGEDEIDQGADEAPADAGQAVKHNSNKVNIAIPVGSSVSGTTEDRTTLGDVETVDDTYDTGEEVEHSSNVEAQGDPEEIVAFDHFSDNKEQGTHRESYIDNEGNLMPAAESEPDVPEEKYWEDDLDGEGEFDTTWDEGHENTLSQSNHSSVTLSSTASKRSFDEFESVGDLYDEETGRWSPPSSPDPKRSRIR